MTLDRDQALAAAERYLLGLADELGQELSIDVRSSSRTAEGWLFYWNTAAYLDGGSVSDALAGNGPLLVDSRGAVSQLPPQVDPGGSEPASGSDPQ